MKDLPILLALLAVAWSAWRRPWVGVLGLVFVGVMNPQSYATAWLEGAPVYAVVLGVVVLSAGWQFVAERRVPVLFWDWRMAVAVLLALQMLLSTWQGINPWGGWPRLIEIAKMVPVLVLVLLLIDDRDKLRWLLITIALSIAVVVLKGGFWAVLTGLQERVYGPPRSQYHDNNFFAVATSMCIPLLVLWFRQVRDPGVRWFLGVLIALGFVAALSSWSRGGLLSISAVAFLLVWHSRRRWLALPLLLAGVGAVLVGMPDEWLARMQTLQAPASDGSAASRLEVWRLGWDHALQHPWLGGGLGGWIYLSQPTGGMLAWHSAYVSIAAEHGLVGLALWCTLVFGSMVQLSWTIRQEQRQQQRRGRVSWQLEQAAMLRTSLMAYAVGCAFISIAYWELLYLIVAASIVMRRLADRPVPPKTATVSQVSDTFTFARSAPVDNQGGAA